MEPDRAGVSQTACRLLVAAHLRRQPTPTTSAIFWPVRWSSRQRTKTAEGIIDASLSGQPGNRKIYIAWDEWNVWYRARGKQQRGRRILEEHYNLEDALVVATFLNTFINHAHIVKMANMAQLVNVIAPIFTNESGCSCRRFTTRCSYSPATPKATRWSCSSKAPKYKAALRRRPVFGYFGQLRQRFAGIERGQPASRPGHRNRIPGRG